jgi:hypothetical protein
MEDRGEAPVAIAEDGREADPDVGAGAEHMDEPDTEHRDLQIEDDPWRVYSEKG